jgi:hypothetical protein
LRIGQFDITAILSDNKEDRVLRLQAIRAKERNPVPTRKFCPPVERFSEEADLEETLARAIVAPQKVCPALKQTKAVATVSRCPPQEGQRRWFKADATIRL